MICLPCALFGCFNYFHFLLLIDKTLLIQHTTVISTKKEYSRWLEMIEKIKIDIFIKPDHMPT